MIGTVPKRKFIRRTGLAALFIFAVCMTSLVRTSSIQTNDLFHFGRGHSWWCYAIVNYFHVSASLEVYDAKYSGGFLEPAGKLFFFHLAAIGGIWTVSRDDPKLSSRVDLGIWSKSDFTVAGLPAFTAYDLNLGPLFALINFLICARCFLLASREMGDKQEFTPWPLPHLLLRPPRSPPRRHLPRMRHPS